MNRYIDINQAITETSSELIDVVKTVSCNVRFVIDGKEYFYQKMFDLDSPDPLKFVSFDALDKQTVLQWIEDKYSSSVLAELEQLTLNDHQLFLNPPAVLSMKTFNF